MIHPQKMLYVLVAVVAVLSLSGCATAPDPLIEAFGQHYQSIANHNAKVEDFNKRWQAAMEVESTIMARCPTNSSELMLLCKSVRGPVMILGP